eukprot:m.59844 g.59844  ORF g.59844 m.59844 type:complete len:374 (-) comp11276_c0_seq4:92-1213(-)
MSLNQSNKRRKVDNGNRSVLNTLAVWDPFTVIGGKDRPTFPRPEEVGCFSLDMERNFHDDDSELRVYQCPKMGVSLRQGYTEFVAKDEQANADEHLNNLLRWIIAHSDRRKDLGNVDFVTWRGQVTKMMLTPYETKNGWKLAAILHKGTIYLSAIETEESKLEKQNRTARQQEMCYWGYKFEQYCTKSIHQQEQPGDTVNSNPEYVSVAKIRINNISLLIAGEVDCICLPPNETKAPPIGKRNYVELKTNVLLESRRIYTFERYKLLKFWAQAFLLNIPNVIVGFRDDEGIVKKLQTFKTQEIPKFVRGKEHAWDGTLCLKFQYELLGFMQSVVTKPNTAYIFQYDPQDACIRAMVSDKQSDFFLPTWFTDKH